MQYNVIADFFLLVFVALATEARAQLFNTKQLLPAAPLAPPWIAR